jgi:hypothetical protein
MFFQKQTFLNICVFVGFVKCLKNCQTVDPKNDHFQSVIFGEAHGSGLGSQLYVFALMAELRAKYYFNTFVSRECRSILSNVFTATSLNDVPVFEDTFCVDHPSSVGHFEVFTEDVQNLIQRDEYRQGRLIWLWPHKEKLAMKSLTEKRLPKKNLYNIDDIGLHGYR